MTEQSRASRGLWGAAPLLQLERSLAVPEEAAGAGAGGPLSQPVAWVFHSGKTVTEVAGTSA